MRLHLLNSIRKYSYKNLNIAQPYLNEGYFIHSAPGLRLIELNDPKNGNILTSKLVEAISTKLLSYSDNMIVQAVMFHSFARNKLFSHGVKSEEFKNDPKKLLQSLHKLSTTIESFDKPTLASYSGNLNATALGVFSTSTYRLVSPCTRLYIDELFHGYLPIGGAAYYLVHKMDEGVAMARFLALSKREYLPEEIYELGLATHYVEDDPSDFIINTFFALSSDNIQEEGVQGEPTNIKSLEAILEVMNLDSDVDLLSARVWNRISAVPPARAAEPEEEGPDSLKVLESVLITCFSEDDPNETKKLLKKNGSDYPYLLTVLETMESVDNNLVNAWYSLTRKIVDQTLEQSFTSEIEAITSIR